MGRDWHHLDPDAKAKVSGAGRPTLLVVEDMEYFIEIAKDALAAKVAELTKAVEAKVAESQAAVKNLVETNLKNAPAGSDAAVAAIKTAFEASQTAAETLKKVAKQAADTAEANFKAASAQAETAVKSTIAKAKAKA